MELGLSGLASGFDWQTLVDQLTEVERAPQRRMRTEQTKLQQINNSYSSVKTQLSTLKLRIDALKETSLFDSRTTKVSDSALASATAAPGTPSGSYIFNILQLATTSKQRGGNDAGARLNASNNVSGLVLSNAGFAVGVTAGTFSVNGQQVTIATSDTLQAVFDKISTATGGTVTGSYDSATDKITLSSAGTITLGSAVDTSNFLQVAKLYNNGTNSIASSSALGVVKLDSVLNAANFATAISDGGSGAGEFKINGVSISFNASTEKVSDIIKKINDSSAGVIASYDSVNDRFILTNKQSGDVGISLQDVTGNFLAATKLSSGALERGNNLLYTINGGPTLVSQTNSITEASSGITGLTVEALKASSSPDASNANKQLIATFGGTGGSSDEISTANPHGYLTGDAVRFDTNGTLPSQVNTSTIYYIRKIDDTTVSLHATASEAANGSNPINFGNNPSYSGDNYLYLANPPAAAGESASTVTVTVSNDTSKIKTAINDFIAEYNKVQSLIDTETDVTTDSAGKVKAGTLAGQSDANDIASKLRSEINALVSGLTGVFDQLSDLGIQSNGNDNSITLSDSTALDTALANNLSSVRELFTQSSSGIAAKLSAYLDSTIGEEGSLVTRQDSLTKQISSIDTQITDQERFVQSRRQQLIDSFIAMEKAQAQINQQLQFLKQRFPAA